MTWIDNNGEVRPQSWEEYLEMKGAPSNTCDCLICIRIRQRESQHARKFHPREPRPTRTSRESKTDSLPRMRIRLFRADPHCFWCGIEVQLERMTIARKDNLSTLATVDHLYSRWHPERKIRHTSRAGSDLHVLHVLACHGCNQERAGAETQMRPFIPKLKERLSFAQRADATLAQAAVRAEKHQQTPSAKPPQSMRVIQTIEEALEYAREHPAR